MSAILASTGETRNLFMTSKEIRSRYLKFFEDRGHKIIPSAPLVPENDPSTLFISAGMQPLVPYLLGETHPEGSRLVDSQKCIRTGDIEEVGDAFHHTFFEMLGNWSLGDYFKEQSIPWSYEFLTQELHISPERLSVSVFAGDDDAPRDIEAAEIWKQLGIPEERIYYFGKEDNWWAAGPTGPCGPDTEIFYDVTRKPCGPDCRPGDNCGRYFEIWNNVFMVYNRKEDGSLEELPNKNVDTGMGLDRTTTVLSGLEDNYQNDLFKQSLESLIAIHKSGPSYKENPRPYRIILDHLRAAIFAVSDGVEPSNKGQGYVLRRLIRRAMIQARKLGMDDDEWLSNTLPGLIQPYLEEYPVLGKSIGGINQTITAEVDKFRKTIKKGLTKIDKLDNVDGNIAFDLFQTYGFPLELTLELAQEKGQKVDIEEFKKAFEEHQEKSRSASAGVFKGGLADHSDEVTRLHTAHHLLLAALQKIVDPNITQKGSNITAERLRMDFNLDRKLIDEEIKKVQDLMNHKIDEDLPVTKKIMSREEAEKIGAQMEFAKNYPDQVSVYFIGDENEAFSKEFCGGPHVNKLSDLKGHVTITKQDNVGSGVRRIYAQIN